MPLFIVATPIGNPKDLSDHAREVLASADLVIGEELKVLRQQLKAAGVQAPAMDQLNEHSDPKDVEFLLGECRSKKVALVSDCGTPGFCDPGADLARACHKAGVAVHAVPGASSLMALLSVAGARVDSFVFQGFLPAKNELREAAWASVVRETRAVIVMETPYRCEKFLAEIAARVPQRLCVVGLNLTAPNERLLRVRGAELTKLAPFGENEPIVLILPAAYRE